MDCIHIYHLTWAGFTLLILIWGQCEGLTTGISAERNFTPTSFFCFHKFGCFSVNGDDGWQGSAGQHTYCVPTAQTPRCKPEKQKTTNTFIYYQTLLLTIKHFKRMKKNFLLLLWMTLLPLAGWAQTDLSDGWEITFNPTSPQTYTGNDLLPVVKLTHTSYSEITSGFNVVWKNQNGEVVTEAKNVGWYEATVTGDMTNTYGELANPSKKFWILKATPSVTTPGAVMVDVAYDGAEHALVTTAPVYTFGTVEYSLDEQTWSTDIPKGKKVGEYTVYVRVQGTDNWNPIASTLLGSPKITGTNVVAADITAPTAKTGLKFTNEDQVLINEGTIVTTAAVKELQYKVGSGEWSTAIPTAKNAGTYNVSYKAVGKDGYNDYVAPSTVDVTIDPDAPTLTAPVGAASLTYTGEAQNLIATDATATLGATVKYQVAFKAVNATVFGGYGAAAETATGTDAGTYKVKAVVEAGGNYSAAESAEIEVTLAQAKAFATDADKPKAVADLTWNNAAQQLITATPVTNGIVNYSLNEGSWGTDITAMKGTNAGNYKVDYKVTNPNYEGYDEIIRVDGTKINKKVVSVKVNDIEKTYDGTATITPATAPGYSFIGRIADGLNFSGVSLSATTKINVGKYDGEVTVAKTALEGVSTNYDYTIIPGKLTINPVEVTITANTGLEITYGENPNIASEYTSSTLVGSETLADVFSTLPVLTTNAAAEKPSIGTYTLSFTPGVLKENGNYKMSTNGEKNDGYVIGSANFVVNPEAGQKIVITVLPQTHVYTGVAEDFSTMEAGVDYYVSGLLDSDELSKAPTFSRSNPETFDVGTYDLIASGAEISDAIANKYPGGIVYNNSTLEITAKELKATVNTQTVQVGAVADDLNKDAWSVEGLVNDEDKSVLGGTLALKANATDAENAGINDGIILSITNTNYTLKTGTQYGKLIVIPAGDLGLSDDPTNDNFTKINTFDGNEHVNVQVQLSNREQAIGSSNFTWGAKEYQILVLPFNVTVSEISEQLGYAVVNVVNPAKATADNIYWSLEWGTIPANTPFTVRTAEAIPAGGKILSFTDKKIEAPKTAYPSVDAGNGFKVVGAYEAYTIDNSSASKERFYAGGQHHGISASSANSWTVNPFDGYVDLSGSKAPEFVTFTFEDIDGSTTAIRSITAETAGAAQTYGEGWYTLNGVKLQGAPVEKGVYIKDGKKVVVK